MPRNHYTLTRDSVTIHIGSQTYTVKAGDPNFNKARQAALDEDWDSVPALVSKGLGLFQWLGEHPGFAYKDNHIYFEGERIPTELNERLIKMEKNGDDSSFLLRFWERLQENPSYRSVHQLWPFLKHGNIPIDENGFIICYKGVTNDYLDCHSRTVNNRPGQRPKMRRNKVSDEYDIACHDGYHVGTVGFAQGFGKRVVVVRVDPKDVCCVSKHSTEKMRVCEYEVLGNYGDALPDTVYDTRGDVAIAKARPPATVHAPVSESKAERKMENPPPPKEALADGAEAEPWESFGDLSPEELGEQNMANLRKYASRVLKIVGAGKLRKFHKDESGKEVGLVNAILQVRDDM